MATISPLYGSNNQAITVTMASLANGSARASTAVNNTSAYFPDTTYVDALVQITVKSGASGVSSTGIVNVYAYATVDGGTTYPEGITGTDAGITLTSPPNLRKIGTINVVANATEYYSEPFSVAAAFNGNLPAEWGIVIENKSGAALDSTEGNHNKRFQGINYQSV